MSPVQMSPVHPWLADALSTVAAEPERIRGLFPAVSRTVGRDGGADDEARGDLLAALQLPRERLVAEITDLYRFGDAGEKRGVLRSLHRLDAPLRPDGIGPDALSLVHDGLRSNDTRLVEAALGRYGSAHLDDDAWRQGVLKCVFTGVPLAAVDRLDERSDTELARMLIEYARERVAAGRAVPADVWTVLERFPDQVAASDLPGKQES